MVFDINRLYIGFLILVITSFCFFFEFDYLILITISILIIYDLYKSSFIKNIYDFTLSLIFLILSNFLLTINNFIEILNIILIILTLSILIRSNFHHQKLFLIIILIFLLNFFAIFNINRNLLYFIIFISFFNDTIAYICGNLFKGPLIIPLISPKKTWSGTILSFLASSIMIYFLGYPIFISILLSISLFFGDVFFSYIKRINNIKDFSNILKGHGGILDRLDSMFFFIIIISYHL